MPKKTMNIEEALKSGPLSNKGLRKQFGTEKKVADPKLDRTLQQLRKDGKIKCVDGKWRISTFETCPTCKGKGWLDK